MAATISSMIEQEDKIAADLIVSVAHAIRAAERWHELADAVGSKEVLLIGHYDNKSHYDSDDEDGGLTIRKLERLFQQSLPSVNVGGIVMKEDNTFLKRQKDAFSDQVKATCGQLDGISDLIIRFAKACGELTGESSSSQNVAAFDLADEINRRIESVFGKYQPESESHEESESDDSSSSDEEDSDEVYRSDEEGSNFDEDFCKNFVNNDAFGSFD
ncbi:hypothetical protein F5884DRAFT_851338 [Xylogone sp. PMI_703]|nr:hypothetical protein F5884DRAFT_851338 [Xylogone sp. PMI_703]